MQVIDHNRLNEARWAACNTRDITSTSSLEWATELADKIVAHYLGLSPEEWHEQMQGDSAYGE